MSEAHFRYVPVERVLAWIELGWVVISGEQPLRWPTPDLHEVVIVEWPGRGDPVVPVGAASVPLTVGG